MTRPPRARRLRGRVRRRDAAATREALLAAGIRLFAERGFDGVTVRAIAERAEVNVAMISYHFGGKRKLYRAIVGSTFSEIAGRLERLAELPRPAPDLLRDLIAVVGEMVARRHPHFCTMMLREVLTGGKHLEPEVIEQPLRIFGAVQRIVERGVRERTLRPVDPVLTHLSLVGSLVFFFATSQFRERVFADRLRMAPPDGDAYVRHIQDLITHGLSARRGGRLVTARSAG